MNRFIRNLPALTLVLAMLTLLSAVSTPAQTFRGTILGSVTDSSGAAVPGATVTVKNLDTGLVRVVPTSDDGSYAVPELPIGNYSVSVEKTGFRLGVVTGIRVEVSIERRADVALQTGQLAQTVEVTGEELPLVESTSNTLGGIIETKVAENLPVNGRDYLKLMFLMPGVTGSPDQITDSPGSFGTVSVNGARGRSANFLLDGTDMNDGYRNDPAINEGAVYGTPGTILPIDAIAELRIASNFEAEFGRSAGGVIQIVTRSGNNQIHGTGFDYLRNTDLNARNYFNPDGQAKQPFHYNQFGGSIGGPIIKDRTFFFVDYEGVRETGGLNYTARVPSAKEISDLSTALGGTNSVIAELLLRNPWPTPNILNVPEFGSANNVFVNTPFSNRVDSAIVKIDHNFNKDNLLTGRYYIGDSLQSFPLGLVGGSLLPGFNVTSPTRVQMIALSYVSVLAPSVVNEVRVGWNRFVEGFFPQDRSFDPHSIGLETGVTSYNFGLPRINVGSYAQIGANNTTPRQRVDTNWHYVDNVSWKHGKHDFKAGYEFRRTSITQLLNFQFRGKLSFGGYSADTFCAANFSASSLCPALEGFLAGLPTGGSIYSGNTYRNAFENSQSVYFQDSFRLSKHITVNAGLRYDYNGLFSEKHGLLTNVDPTTGTVFLVGTKPLYNKDLDNFAPRLSVAWDVFGTGRTVVRSGFGIFYDNYAMDHFMGQAPYNSNFDAGNTYSGSPLDPKPISVAGLNGGTLTAGTPVFSLFPSPMGDAFGVDKNIRTPYMENYNLNIQQQLGKRSVLQLGYVGSQGHRLFQTRDINQPSLSQIQQFNYAVASGFKPADLNPQSVSGCYCTPRAITGNLTYINWLATSANSNYNSLQASWRIDNWHGLTNSLNYTWSHSIDDASDGWDYVPNAAQPDNSSVPVHSNKGNSNFDVRNRFTWNFVYQIPDSKDSSLKMLRNGWGINGIVTIQAGQPFHLNYNFEDDYNGAGEGFARPDVVGKIVYNQHDPNNFLDLTAFAVPCTLGGGGTGAGNCQLINPATGAICTAAGIGPNCINSMHFGSLGRNALLGPHFRQFDLSLFKDTTITERLKVQLRFEAYNLFNHPNFANPYLPLFIADAAQQGIDNTGRSTGHYQLTSTGDVGIGYPTLGNGGSRSLQISARFTF